MLDFYGQSPIIVRSSSLLEDGFGNAFTGKYESVFCPNQGSPEERLEALLAAVKTVYASAMSEEALRYRERRGLLDRDEQMAVLVQRVSGAVHGPLFYPQVAGVALSYNPYVWNHAIDPHAGVVRLVFGLGTRAVERADDDYTRIVALNAPRLRPETTLDEVTRVRAAAGGRPRPRGARVPLGRHRRGGGGEPRPAHRAVRDPPPAGGRLGAHLRRPVLGDAARATTSPTLLRVLREAYRSPVDVEFTANFLAVGELRLNLVQCRPLQVREGAAVAPPPADLPEEAVVLASRGPVVGQSRNTRLDRVIYVDPDAYAALGTQDRYETARVVGRVTRHPGAAHLAVLLAGPGRWGTTTVALGVPVSFPEIQRVTAICEVMRLGHVVPDVSLGSISSTTSSRRTCSTSRSTPATTGTAWTRRGCARRRTGSPSCRRTTPGWRPWSTSWTSRSRATPGSSGCTSAASRRPPSATWRDRPPHPQPAVRTTVSPGPPLLLPRRLDAPSHAGGRRRRTRATPPARWRLAVKTLLAPLVNALRALGARRRPVLANLLEHDRGGPTP